MIQLAALDDARVREYQATARPEALRAAGLFVAEGRLVVQRLLESHRFVIRSVLVTHAALDSLRALLDAHAPSVPVYVIGQDQMNAVVGFDIHRGCLALAERPLTLVFDALSLSSMCRIVVLEGVSNPDNVGGVFRNAAAFDVDLVVLGPNCGDPLYRKAIRTSMASSLLVPFAAARQWPGAIGQLAAAGFQTVALTPSPDAVSLRHVSLGPRTALLLGSEAEGLSREALAAASVRTRIAMGGRIDSLNVATAAAVALYQLASASDR
ncbi:MAG: TrmH family RNA methyltransferase [Vicinamibacterales bacterium]